MNKYETGTIQKIKLRKNGKLVTSGYLIYNAELEHQVMPERRITEQYYDMEIVNSIELAVIVNSVQ